jgi:hypothetical protein
MASYTSNLNLKKPALTDDALVTDLNDNSDKLDAAISAGSGAIAIVSVGNTHAAISSGQYVYVRQHGSLSEGLYKATTNIAANGTLSGSNLTAVPGGGLNSVYSALSDQIAAKATIKSWSFKVDIVQGYQRVLYPSENQPSDFSATKVICIQATVGNATTQRITTPYNNGFHLYSTQANTNEEFKAFYIA